MCCVCALTIPSNICKGPPDKAVIVFLVRQPSEPTAIGLGSGELGQHRRDMASESQSEQAAHCCSAG